MEKFKAEINLKKIRSQKYFERFQTLDAHMIAHFTMNYDNDIGNSLTELWENDCLKQQQKSVNIFDRKRDWYLNNTTTEFCNNSEKRKRKQESKENNSNRRTQNGQSQIFLYPDIKIVKIEAEAEVLLKKEQITKGLQNKMQKMIRTKNTLHQRNQEITTATRKRSINLGNSIVLQNNKKAKQLLMWL